MIPCERRFRCCRVCKRPCADYQPDGGLCVLMAIGVIIAIYLLASAVGAAITRNKGPEIGRKEWTK